MGKVILCLAYLLSCIEAKPGLKALQSHATSIVGDLNLGLTLQQLICYSRYRIQNLSSFQRFLLAILQKTRTSISKVFGLWRLDKALHAAGLIRQRHFPQLNSGPAS